MADTIAEVARLGPLLLIAIAACGGEHGAFLAITSPVTLSRVELFVGDTTVNDSGSCSGGSGCRIGPPSTDLATPLGVRYVGDGYTSNADAAQFAAVSGTKLTYKLEPNDQDAMLPAMMIVGYDANATPVAALVVHDVAVTGEAEQLDVTLTAVGAITDPTGERVQVWRRPTDDKATQSACALIVHGDNRQPEWFVPFDDTDCDGAIPQDPNVPECKGNDSAWNYCGQYSPTLSQTDSVMPQTNGSCRLAGPQCIDAGPACRKASGEALTVPIGCLQPEYCHAAMNNACSSFDQACLATALSAAIYPRISCPAFSTLSNTPCTTRIDPTFSGGTPAPIIAGRNVTRLDITQIEPFQTGQQSVDVAGTNYATQPTGTPGVYDIVITGPAVDTPSGLLLDYVTDPTPIQHRYIELYLEQTTNACQTNPPALCLISTSPYVCP